LPPVGTLHHDIYPNLRAIPVARKGVITFVVDDAELSVFIVSITYADADWLGRVHLRER
jgi:plasmid stabilization system protein ParE